MPQSKFMDLVESAITRYTNGGILVGDVVKFVSKFSSRPSYQGLSDEMKKVISDHALTATTKNLRVINVKPQFPSSAPGNENNRGNVFSVELAFEVAPGMVDLQNKFTVPGDLVANQDFYPNLPDINDDIRKQEKIDQKPVPVEDNEETTDIYVQTMMVGDRKLPTKNVKIPSVTTKQDNVVMKI